ncbi:MAG: restriction endonuclease subunit S [Bacteroidales bacterium]|nr:restriction endonuclease subunit S [Bacteroidales bacterium]
MEYTIYRLGDIAEVKISGVDKKTHDEEVPVRLCNFVDVYYNWAITKEMTSKFMAASANDKEIESFTLHRGQVAITKDSETRDDIGIAAYIADDFEETVLLGYHTALITPNEEVVNGKYLNALLHSKYFHDYWFNNATGSGMRYTLSEQCIRNASVYLPSLDEQKKIGNVLSSLDRKIALNRKANELLESMAKQLYDYWFVQFDFPNEEGKPYKSSGGKMVYNETLKRDIPEGWEVKHLFEAVNVLYGFPFATEYFTEEVTDKPLIRIRDILEGTISAYTTEEIDDKYLLERGDVVIGMDGNFHMNYWHNDSTYINQRCVRLRMLPNSPISAMQTLHSLKPYIKAKELNAKGSTVGHLSDKDLKEMFLLLPLVTNFFNPRERFDGLLHKIIANRNETLRLTSLRDYLLPLLMNGQVKVS